MKLQIRKYGRIFKKLSLMLRTQKQKQIIKEKIQVTHKMAKINKFMTGQTRKHV